MQWATLSLANSRNVVEYADRKLTKSSPKVRPWHLEEKKNIWLYYTDAKLPYILTHLQSHSGIRDKIHLKLHQWHGQWLFYVVVLLHWLTWVTIFDAVEIRGPSERDLRIDVALAVRVSVVVHFSLRCFLMLTTIFRQTTAWRFCYRRVSEIQSFAVPILILLRASVSSRTVHDYSSQLRPIDSELGRIRGEVKAL